MSRQLRLELKQPPSYRREDFVISGTNAEAVRALDAWPNWHGGVLALTGPEGSGKTHLARAWMLQTGAVELSPDKHVGDLNGLRGRSMLLETAESAESETLFHLINMAAHDGGGLLLTSRAPPS